MKNIEYGKRQYQLSTLRAKYWLASVTSGHYKQRQIFHGTGTDSPFTDDEKLARAMATANRHIELAAEFAEGLADAESESEAP